jgi:hypothetical protein
MKLSDVIQPFSLTAYIYALAIVLVLIESVNLPMRLKILFNLKLSKRYKLIDCMPCLSFWTSLIITFNPTVAFAVFLTIKFYDKDRF